MNEDVKIAHKYFVSLPIQEAHHKCHPTKGVMGLSQRVHPEIIAKIHELVSVGTIEPVEVQRLLKHHVNHYNMCHETFLIQTTEHIICALKISRTT